MEIKWENNSRVKHLAAIGKIEGQDIIPRSTTDDFPAGTATVRIQKVREKKPHVVIHIRGKAKSRKMWNGNAYECAATCRVTLAGLYSDTMCSNGDLDEDLSWLDVHNIVTEVKEAIKT